MDLQIPSHAVLFSTGVYASHPVPIHPAISRTGWKEEFHAEQVGHGAGLEPVTVQPPFAARIKQAISHQCFEDMKPAGSLAADGQSGLPERIQIELVSQLHRQPASATLAWMAQGHFAEAYLDGIGDLGRRCAILREQTHLPNRIVRFIEHIERRTPLCLLRVVEFAQIEKLPLYHPSPGAYAFHNTPVTVLLAVFDSPMTFQIHAVIFTQKNGRSTGRVCPTARFEKRTLENKG